MKIPTSANSVGKYSLAKRFEISRMHCSALRVTSDETRTSCQQHQVAHAVWKARREFFTGSYPVSTLIEISKLVSPELCVEIEAVGYLSDDDEDRSE